MPLPIPPDSQDGPQTKTLRGLNRQGSTTSGTGGCYTFGIAKALPFIDGNRRAAFLSLVTFLGLNGIDFLVEEAEAVVMIRGLAAGVIDEAGLARWIRENVQSP